MSSFAANAKSVTDPLSADSTEISVIKRDGSIVVYQPSKIGDAITKAIKSVDDPNATPQKIKDRSVALAEMVNQKISHLRQTTGLKRIHIEEIQNLVQFALQLSGEDAVLRNYIHYRLDRNNKRKEKLQIGIKSGRRSSKISTEKELENLMVKLGNNSDLLKRDQLIMDVMRGIYEGIKYEEVLKLIYMNASSMVQHDPEYTYLAAAALYELLLDEVNQGKERTEDESTLFERGLEQGIQCGIIDSDKAKRFDLKRLGKAIDPERNKKFTYIGLKTLYDRYLLHHEKTRYETPQGLFMRVSMGLSVNEENPNEKAIEFYNLISSFDYMPSTPTLFNSLTIRPQLSSCYLTTISDDLTGIFAGIAENAQLSKYAGGIGNDWSLVRALGSHIKGTNGESQGVVPFLKVANDTAVAVNQGGKRKGAVCAYLETWHLDIEDFLELRKNTGDERRRTHDMNTANWIPDLFMERVANEADWTLFSPDEVPDLHEAYGLDFRIKYESYEQLATEGKIRNFKTVKATDLWKKMLGMIFETGHPWITFKDPCNIRSPQKHTGVVHSSNLCTEITLNTSEKETAVCNLGSVNLPAHIDDEGNINHAKLRATVSTAIRILDNVIDENYYPSEKARYSNIRHRPIGLGQMGFQDVLYKLRIPFGSESAVKIADQLAEAISYYAISASAALAQERGSYESFEGSSWSKGQVPFDSIAELEKQRGQYVSIDKKMEMDWEPLRQMVAKGMRNSNTMAIAPTATISNITGLFQSIEPAYKHLYTKSNLSGEFTYSNQYLVAALKEAGVWDEKMVEEIKQHEGLVSSITRIPKEIRDVFATAFEIEPQWLVEGMSRRQKWIDQGASLNLYMSEPSGPKLDKLYKLAWVRGLKTTYYLRTLGASGTREDIEDDVPELAEIKACSILNAECESCQ